MGWVDVFEPNIYWSGAEKVWQTKQYPLQYLWRLCILN
jgi:hypothetical protein